MDPVGGGDIYAAMRQAKSYGIVDRKLLFDRYLHRISIEGLALYLFLCVVGDRDGRSYWGDRSIGDILRFSSSKLESARSELIEARLIDYRAPYWWVRSLSSPRRSHGKQRAKPPARVPRPSGELAPIRGVVPAELKALLRDLEGGSP